MPALKNAKHELFCQEYIYDLNATKAYLRTGYSEKGAGQSAARLLKDANVYARIEELQKKRLDKLQINTDWVLLRFIQVSDRCMQAEEVEVFDYATKSMKKTGEFVFDSTGANKATEMVGKHLGMFKDKLEFEDKTMPNLSKLSTDEKMAYLELQKKLRG